MTSELRVFAAAGDGNKADAVPVRTASKKAGRKALMTMKPPKQDAFQRLAVAGRRGPGTSPPFGSCHRTVKGSSRAHNF
jgi:hypothetical protein